MRANFIRSMKNVSDAFISRSNRIKSCPARTVRAVGEALSTQPFCLSAEKSKFADEPFLSHRWQK